MVKLWNWQERRWLRSHWRESPAAFQEEPGLSWPEIARRIGTYRHTVWRWTEGVVRPNVKHMLALLELANDLGLGCIFTEQAAARR